MTEPTDKLEQMRVTVNQDLYPELAQYLLRYPAGKTRTMALIRLADRGLTATEAGGAEPHRQWNARTTTPVVAQPSPPAPPPAASVTAEPVTTPVQQPRTHQYDAHATHEVVDAQEVFPNTNSNHVRSSKPEFNTPSASEVNQKHTDSTHQTVHSPREAMPTSQGSARPITPPSAAPGPVIHPSRIFRATEDSASAKAARKLPDNLIGN